MIRVTQVLATTNEISLKGGNRKWFERKLTENVRRALVDLPVARVTRPAWRVLISFSKPVVFAEAARRLHTVFGLGGIMAVEHAGFTMADLEAAVEPRLEGISPSTFAVRCIRSDQTFPLTTPEIERSLGSFVQEKTGWPVKLSDPDLTIHVLVDENGIFAWTKRVPGPGGLPVGVGGRACCLLSGGIDSPVAAYMMMKRGMRLDFVHFHSVPRTDPASLEKVHDLVRVLNRYQGQARLAMVPLLEIQEQIAARCPASLRVLLYRRFMLGLAGGMLDSGVNAYVAVHRGTRAMGIVHTGFGIGSTLGPLLVTVFLALGVSWRIAFASLAAADLILALAFLATVSAIEGNIGGADRRPSAGDNRLILGLSVTVFFLYAGVAAGTGAWTFSLFTEGRGISDGVAGLAVAAYWAGMTVARIALGVFGDRLDPNRVLTVSGIATVASLTVMWLAPTPWFGIVGLIASGVSHGAVFPLEVLLTPRRFGAAFTPWAVGYEIAGANVGVAVLSGSLGLLVGRLGIDVVAPTLVVLALLLWGAMELLRVRSAQASPASGSS